MRFVNLETKIKMVYRNGLEHRLMHISLSHKLETSYLALISMLINDRSPKTQESRCLDDIINSHGRQN